MHRKSQLTTGQNPCGANSSSQTTSILMRILLLPRLIAATFISIVLGLATGASAQTAQWVKQMGTGGISNGVSSDAAGNAYATGIVSNTGLFEDVVIPCDVSDVFLPKYSVNATLLLVVICG